jgi:hypothetical protein
MLRIYTTFTSFYVLVTLVEYGVNALRNRRSKGSSAIHAWLPALWHQICQLHRRVCSRPAAHPSKFRVCSRIQSILFRRMGSTGDAILSCASILHTLPTAVRAVNGWRLSHSSWQLPPSVVRAIKTTCRSPRLLAFRTSCPSLCSYSLECL